MQHYAVFSKLAGRNIEPELSGVFLASNPSEAASRFARQRGLGADPTPTVTSRKLHVYSAGAWRLSVRVASDYEKEGFRILRGPQLAGQFAVGISDLPVVTRGFPEDIRDWARIMGLEWIPEPRMLLGGYYRNSSGDCYYLDI